MPKTSTRPLVNTAVDEQIENLVVANRILAEHGVVDAFGHVSVRSPLDASRYFLSRSLPPEQVTRADIMEFDQDSALVDGRHVPTSRQACYLERFIHGAIYRARPDVGAVVHTHSQALIPFSVTALPLKPIYHMCAFVGQGVPVFDIRADDGDASDMLIRDDRLGRSLAQVLRDKPAALMRGHGAVVAGATLSEAVGRSVYLEINARLQMQAMAMAGDQVTYLSAGETSAAEVPMRGYERSWTLWRPKALARLAAEADCESRS